MHSITRLASLALLLASPLFVGCRGPRVHMYPDAPVVEDGVRIAVQDAWKRGDRLVVRANVANRSTESITVSRSDFSLRLDDGSTLHVRSGKRAARDIHIARGRDASVTMEFDAPEVRDISTATLLISGTSGYEGESLAEVKLATTHAKAFGKKHDRHAKKRKHREATASVDPEEASSTEEAEELQDTEEEDTEEPAELEEEPEDWVIGSN